MNIQKPTTEGASTSSVPSSKQNSPSPHRTANLTLWILQGLVGATFLTTGLMKLTNQPMPVELFEKLGVGQWLRYVTGTIEVCGGLLVLFPRWTTLAAGLLACAMVGAITSHFTKVGGSPLPAIVLFSLCVVLAWGRRDRFLRRS